MYYSTPEDGGGEADPSHQIYNRLTHDTHNTGGQSQDTGMNSTLQGNYEMGEYSTVSNLQDCHMVGQGRRSVQLTNHLFTIIQCSSRQIYEEEEEEEERSPPQTPQPYTSLDQMYAQVDKKKSKKREVSEDPPCESGDVYSVVNKPSAPEIPQKSQLLLKRISKAKTL